MFLHLNKYTRSSFKNCWLACNRYEAFKLAKEINPELSDLALDHAWQFLNIFHENFRAACLQFEMLINRCY